MSYTKDDLNHLPKLANGSAVPTQDVWPEPWTQKPSCVTTAHSYDVTLCVYTSSIFANGRGISLVTTPEVAEEISKSPAFTDPTIHDNINIEHRPAYIERDIPGAGRGMIATRRLRKGDRILYETPVYISNRDTLRLENENRVAFQEQAVDSLPKKARESLLGLIEHGAGGPNGKIDSIVVTNAFGVQLTQNSTMHNVLFPEISRINHDCRPKSVFSIHHTSRSIADLLSVRITSSIQRL
jgi:hypothetical protein